VRGLAREPRILRTVRPLPTSRVSSTKVSGSITTLTFDATTPDTVACPVSGALTGLTVASLSARLTQTRDHIMGGAA